MRLVPNFICVTGICLLAIGCDSSPSPEADATSAEAPRYVVATEPSDAMPVGQARKETEDGQRATLVGVIGGSTEPFVDGLAAFTIVDPSIPSCAAEEGCPTPWDYCCTQDQVQNNIATVKVVDPSGGAVAEDARQLLGVKELAEIVVSGTVRRDEQGNLTLAANEVFVRE